MMMTGMASSERGDAPHGASIPSIFGMRRSLITRSMWCSLEQRERLLAVLRGVHVVAVALELSAQHPPQVGLVVDDQDLLTLRKHHEHISAD